MAALRRNQQCYAKGSYGSCTTSWYISLSFRCPSLLTAWTSCPDTVHLCSVLCSMGWGCPFLAFVVRGSQAQIVASFVWAQIVASFVWASTRFWRHMSRSRPRMRCTEIPFRYGCIYAEHRDTWALEVARNIWYPTWCTRYRRYLWTLALLHLFLAIVWSIW